MKHVNECGLGMGTLLPKLLTSVPFKSVVVIMATSISEQTVIGVKGTTALYDEENDEYEIDLSNVCLVTLDARTRVIRIKIKSDQIHHTNTSKTNGLIPDSLHSPSDLISHDAKQIDPSTAQSTIPSPAKPTAIPLSISNGEAASPLSKSTTKSPVLDADDLKSKSTEEHQSEILATSQSNGHVDIPSENGITDSIPTIPTQHVDDDGDCNGQKSEDKSTINPITDDITPIFDALGDHQNSQETNPIDTKPTDVNTVNPQDTTTAVDPFDGLFAAFTPTAQAVPVSNDPMDFLSSSHDTKHVDHTAKNESDNVFNDLLGIQPLHNGLQSDVPDVITKDIDDTPNQTIPNKMPSLSPQKIEDVPLEPQSNGTPIPPKSASNGITTEITESVEIETQKENQQEVQMDQQENQQKDHQKDQEMPPNTTNTEITLITDIPAIRTKEEISSKLQSVKVAIVHMEAERETIQSEINKAVANDQFEVAAQLAPRKKKLIADLEKKRNTVEVLEQELKEFNQIAEFSMDSALPKESQPESQTKSNGKNNDTVQSNEAILSVAIPEAPECPDDSPLSPEEENSFRELEEELSSLRTVIVQMESKRDSIQREIQSAAANDEFEVAAKLHSKKKQIITDIMEKQAALEALATELQRCTDEQSQINQEKDIVLLPAESDPPETAPETTIAEKQDPPPPEIAEKALENEQKVVENTKTLNVQPPLEPTVPSTEFVIDTEPNDDVKDGAISNGQTAVKVTSVHIADHMDVAGNLQTADQQQDMESVPEAGAPTKLPEEKMVNDDTKDGEDGDDKTEEEDESEEEDDEIVEIDNAMNEMMYQSASKKMFSDTTNDDEKSSGNTPPGDVISDMISPQSPASPSSLPSRAKRASMASSSLSSDTAGGASSSAENKYKIDWRIALRPHTIKKEWIPLIPKSPDPSSEHFSCGTTIDRCPCVLRLLFILNHFTLWMTMKCKMSALHRYHHSSDHPKSMSALLALLINYNVVRLINDYHHIKRYHLQRQSARFRRFFKEKLIRSKCLSIPSNLHRALSGELEQDSMRFGADKVCIQWFRNKQSRERYRCLTEEQRKAMYFVTAESGLKAMSTAEMHELNLQHFLDVVHAAFVHKCISEGDKFVHKVLKLKEPRKSKNAKKSPRTLSSTLLPGTLPGATAVTSVFDVFSGMKSDAESVVSGTDGLSDLEEEKGNEIVSVSNFVIGIQWEYWDKTKANFVRPKYSNLKTEFLRNALHPMDKNDYNLLWYEAKDFTQCNEGRFMVSKRIMDKSKISKMGREITMEHVMALMTYTNWMELAAKLKRGCRRVRKREKMETLKLRHSEVANWCRLLMEAVVCFGDILGDGAYLYHHIGCRLAFNQFVTQFHIPSSTTSRFAVAKSFGSRIEGGVLLKLSRCVME